MSSHAKCPWLAISFALVCCSCVPARPAGSTMVSRQPRDEVTEPRCTQRGADERADPSSEGEATRRCRPHPFSPEAVRKRWKREQQERDADERRKAFIDRRSH